MTAPQPASGQFRYRDQDGAWHDLEVETSDFNLFKSVGDGGGDIGMDIVLGASSKTLIDPDNPDDRAYDYLLAPAVTTEWTTITLANLTSRGWDALDGLEINYDARTSDAYEAPAAIYDGSYGSVGTMRLALAQAEPFRYRLWLSATDEFDRQVDVDVEVPVFHIVLRHTDHTQNPAAMAWLTEHFDPSGLQAEWLKKGPTDSGWYDLYAHFKETAQ